MLPLDPFDLLSYSSVRTGTLMVPVRPDAACFVARPRVLPRGLRVHVLIRLPVTRPLARCSCLPARDERRDSLACTPTLLALLGNSARTPGEASLPSPPNGHLHAPLASHGARMCVLAEERHAHSPVSVSMLPMDPLGLLVYSCARL
jgi:hypothetical protein